MKLSDKASIDRNILVVLFLMFGIGLVQVYSSSYIFATESLGNGLYFFSKQAIFTVLSILALFIVANIPWKYVERWGYLLWWAAVAGIVLTFVPGFAIKAGGASRWIHLPFGQRIEPSEYLKLALCLWLATFLARRSPWMGRFEWPFKVLFTLGPLVLLLKQPDFGTFAICSLVAFTAFFAFGLKWRYILGSILVVIPSFAYLILSSPYRKARLMTFLDPWSDPEQSGFQVIQSLLSFHSGGVTGVGLGLSQGKLFFLPEAHTDFTLAVLGEEMGFVGFAVILLLYGFLVLRGMQISAQARDAFEKALALTITVTFAFSVFINVGVVLGLLPTKGLTLPFLSYGGSSLLMWSLAFGLLLNIDRVNKAKPAMRRHSRRTWR